jgi:hypothetical protein
MEKRSDIGRNRRIGLWIGVATLALVSGIGAMQSSTFAAAMSRLGEWPKLVTAASQANPNSVPMTTSVLVGHVTWQSIPQNNSRSILPISLTLMSGATEVNYPSQNTDASGFFTVAVDGLANGTYNWRVKGPNGGPGGNTTAGVLANAGTVTLSGAPTTQVEMGTLRAGDANNDNINDTIDSAIFRPTFGRACGALEFDARADFNNDCTVNLTDFNTLKNNFGFLGAPPDSPPPPSNGNASLAIGPGSAGNCPAPSNGGTTNVGCRFALNLSVDAGTHPNIVAEQSYLTFTNALLQNANVSQIATSCVPTNTLTADATTFESTMQNEVCNGPSNCTFRGTTASPGSLAYVSGVLSNPPVGGAFRVAQIGLCANAAGQAVIHWQFSPSAPRDRYTDIVDANASLVQSQSLFANYVINICCTATPTPTHTNTFTITPTNTVTNTPTPTPTNTPCSPDYSYAISSSSIVQGTTLVPGSQCGRCTVPVTLPFPFTFYGQTYTAANVLNVGNVQFATTDTSFTNCLPYPQLGPAILPDWDTWLDTGFTSPCQQYLGRPCGVYTSVSGSSPGRIFNFEWLARRGGSSTYVADFELRLHESTGVFDFVYGTITPPKCLQPG